MHVCVCVNLNYLALYLKNCKSAILQFLKRHVQLFFVFHISNYGLHNNLGKLYTTQFCAQTSFL